MRRPVETDRSGETISTASGTAPPPARVQGEPDSYVQKLAKRRQEMALEQAKVQASMNDPNAALRRAAGLPPIKPPISVFRFTQAPDPSVVLNEDGSSVCPPGFRQANIPMTDLWEGKPGDGNVRHYQAMGYVPARYKGGPNDGKEVHDLVGNLVMIIPDERLLDYMSAANPNMVSQDEFFKQKAMMSIGQMAKDPSGRFVDPVDTSREVVITGTPDSFVS